MAIFSRAYARRKQFEAKLLAQEVVAALSQAFGSQESDASSASTPASATPRPSPATIPPRDFLKTVGIKI